MLQEHTPRRSPIGVELATQSHANLLSAAGLLRGDVRMVSDRPLPSLSEVHGLCIDDFFCLSLEDRKLDPKESKSFVALKTALDVYDAFGLEGSPHKDIYAADSGRVVGAQINTSTKAAKLGVSTVGVPPEKRYGLSSLTLHVAQMGHTSDSLRLSLLGAWTSALTYRRPLMGVLRESYKIVDAAMIDPAKPKLVPLSRSVAQELTMLAILTPLCVSELNAEYMPEVFCSDASSTHGGICVAETTMGISEILWRSCRTKGAYTRLQTPGDLVLQRLGIREPLAESPEQPASVHRPLAVEFDFVEVFAGSGRVSEALSKRGYCCCLPIDLARSEELDVALTHVASWLCFMISEKRVKSFMVEPPCTTFSVMRRPALRDAEFPFGFNTSDPQTSDGNCLAHRGFQLMFTGLTEDVTGILETPNSWRNLERRPSASCCRADSCAFGSVHLKSFKFLGVHADMRPLQKRCSGDHSHVQVQGSFTLGSAIYTPALAEALAEVMARGIARLRAVANELEAVKADGWRVSW